MTLGTRPKRRATSPDLPTEVRLLAEVIRAAPADKLQPSKTTEWGAMEILIHLVFWHQQYVSIINALLQNRKPMLLKGTFKSLNAQCIDQFSACTTAELVASLEQSQRDLDRFSQLEGAKDIRLAFREGSKKWAFPEFRGAIAAHIRRHRLQVEKLVMS